VSSLQLFGMHCAACAGTIESALARVPGVLEARVNAASQRASVRWDRDRTRVSTMIDAIQRAGYGAVPDAAVSARELRRSEQRAVVWRLFVGSFLAMQVMMLATPSYVAGPGELAPDLAQLLNWGSWVLSIPVLWFGAMPFFRGAMAALRNRRINMDVPVALGLAVAFIASTGATFAPGGVFGHEVYYDSLTMFVAFLWLGRWLEMRARHQAAETLESVLSGMPAVAWRVDAVGAVQEVPVARLQPGDTVRVPVGAAIPADGRLLTDYAGVGEALLTGESQPVAKCAGDALLAGSLNVVAGLEMRVERVGADTRFEAIVALMREALAQRPGVARLADRIAGPFLWAVLGLAALATLFWLRVDPEHALGIGVAVLIVTCPCALSLATPATLVAAASGLARRGVLLRHLDALQSLAQLRTLYLDKTGTLTRDAPVLAAVRLTPQAAGLLPQGLPVEAAALQQAAALAAWSSHPLSVAVVQAARTAAPPLTAGATAPQVRQPADAESLGTQGRQPVHEVAGQGLEMTDAQARSWRLGSAAWALRGHEQAGPAPADSQAVEPAQPLDEGVWLSCHGVPVACLVFDEPLREDAAASLDALRADGLTLAILSGDRTERVQAVALRLGITDSVAQADPDRKLQTVKAAALERGPVGVVGDGINDAPVMAAADVSLAMGHGALVAQQGADAVITSARLWAIVDLRRTAVRCMRIVRQNLAWAAAYNAACIPLAMIGWLPPWAAGLGMAMSSVLVILNAQRAARAVSSAPVPQSAAGGAVAMSQT
jgi:Cu2+-exporting ATPase